MRAVAKATARTGVRVCVYSRKRKLIFVFDECFGLVMVVVGMQNLLVAKVFKL